MIYRPGSVSHISHNQFVAGVECLAPTDLQTHPWTGRHVLETRTLSWREDGRVAIRHDGGPHIRYATYVQLLTGAFRPI